MELFRFISEGCRGSTVLRNVGIYRKITIVAICSVIRTEHRMRKNVELII